MTDIDLPQGEYDAQWQAFMKKLYLDLSEKEREEVWKFLDSYCRIVLRIVDREAREEQEKSGK